MLNFFQSNHLLFLTLASTIGFLAGCIIYKLTLYIPQNLLKNWRIQSWQCLYPQRAIPENMLSTKNTTLKFMPIFILFRKKISQGVFTQSLLPCLGLAFCSTLLSLFIAKYFGLHWTTAANIVLMWGLLLLACIDFKHYLLPDCVTLPLLWLGLFCNTFELFVPVYTAVWGAIIGYLSLWLIAAAFKYFRGLDGIGRGDFKLLALLGAWWGFTPLPFIVMIASLSGATIGLVQIARGHQSLQKPQPFGPYLVLAALVMMFFNEQILC